MMVALIRRDHLIVIARSVSDEATQRPWVAAPLVAARDDEIEDFR